MKSSLLIGLLLLATGTARAQANSAMRLQFRFSRVVLASGDTLAGPVAVSFAVDLLYLAQPDGTVRTLAPAAVAAFAVQGELPNPALANTRPVRPPDPTQVRLFRSLYWQPGPAIGRPEAAFFEQLSSGPVLLLRRQALAHRMAALDGAGGINGMSGTVQPGVFGTTSGAGGVGRGLAPPPPPTRYGTLTEVRDTYYFALATGEVQPVRTARKELLAAFPLPSRPLLETYAQQHQLSFTNFRDLAELTTYGNSLAGPPATEVVVQK